MTAISPPQCEGCFPFPNSPRSPTAQTYFLDDHFDPPKSPMYDYPSEQSPSPTISSAPSSRPPSPDFARTIPEQLPHSPSTLSSLSLDVADDDSDDHDYDDNELILPSFDTHPPAVKEHTPPEPRDVPSETATNSPNSKCQIRAADDASVEAEPSRHVDYLSHEWKEEDIWSSWRYVAARKHDYSNGVRLENATWRTWTKIRLKLETVSPEALNWLKDCDVTWLYGPMKAYGRGDDTPTTLNTSPPPSQLETPTGYPDRKPILKKKTASEMILQRSLLQHTLLQHAGAILKAQEADNGQSRSTSSPASSLGRLTGQKTASLDRTPPYTSSSLSSPSEGRHIHFNNEVSQCIAVEAKDGEGEHGEWPGTFDDGDFINDSIAMEQDFPEAACDSRSPSRSCNENRTIAPLPSTTLKYRGDTPEPPAGSLLDRWYHNYSTSSPSPWPSVETLRPSQSSHSLRLDDADHHDSRSSWQRHPRHAYPSHRSSSWLGESEDEFDIDQDLTSGDALPYEDGDFSDTGVFDKMVDAVNTAKDIAHVIWNVGWRR